MSTDPPMEIVPERRGPMPISRLRNELSIWVSVMLTFCLQKIPWHRLLPSMIYLLPLGKTLAQGKIPGPKNLNLTRSRLMF